MKKVAMITGATSGIGEATAKLFAQTGDYDLIIAGRRADRLKALKKELKEAYGTKVHVMSFDVRDYQRGLAALDSMPEEYRRIDILVNNAGVTRDKLLLQMTEEDFDRVLAVNLKGAFNTCKAVCRSMARAKSGKIINISSVSGLMGNPGQANYAASKAGLIGLTKTLAKEYASRGITCNAIAPGFIETEMTAAMPAPALEAAANAIPAKRMGKPEDVAALALFLASAGADYITGEVIKVDGGLYI